jgi:hypothetical protein
MGYIVNYLADKGIMKIKVSGKLNFAMAEKYSKELLKEAKENNCRKFLIDHSETEAKDGINKLHASGDELQQFGFKNTDRLAIIIAYSGSDEDLLDPASQNNRWCKLKYFFKDDIEKALDWLNSEL